MTVKRIILLIMGLAIAGIGCSHSSQFSKRTYKVNGSGKKSKFDIPIVRNDRVSSWIDYFQGTNRDRFGRYLQRSGRYVEWMRQILKEEGVPQDLVYLALIESGFSNSAYSRAKAVGTWQFIRSTGRHYGLDNNQWLDERRNPEKATRAAAQYLKKLYGDFGDWYLAMAAYNAGEGRVSQAIRRCGCRDFWEMTAPGTRYLKPETKDYVPKFIAAAIIAKNPARYGFSDVDYHEPFAYEETVVDGHLDLSVAAELAEVDFEQMKMLNPELNRFITPPRQYALKLPPGTKEKFELAYADLPAEKRISMITVRVHKGDTVAKIARRYGVDSDTLVSINGLNGKKGRLKRGSYIMVPKAGAALSVASVVNEEVSETHSYRVRRGDTLAKVAKRFGVTQSRIKTQNHLRQNGLRVGQTLKIKTGSSLQGEDLLAYNKKSKGVHQNGVEWLIRREQKANGEEENEISDVSNEVAAESVSVADSPQESEVKVDTIQKISSVTYKVKKGDNLAKIAKRHGMTIAQLKSLNKIKNVKSLKIGQQLIIQPVQHTITEPKREELQEESEELAPSAALEPVLQGSGVQDAGVMESDLPDTASTASAVQKANLQ